MSSIRKKVREISGYTFEDEKQSIESWVTRAQSFKAAATVLNQSDIPEVQYAYFYYALVLVFKVVCGGLGIALLIP
ncbi:hypothetical protein [Vibrio diabolicus]|uniref:hypothetical protein n=1 Tax=Vibrio diabolicus TaxID=50719 RepID=UPI002EDA71E3